MGMIKDLPFEWRIGARYTRAGKRSGRNSFVSFISLVSMAGIALGVASLIVVLSVMNGFKQEVTDRMLAVLSHIELYDASGSLSDWHGMAAATLRNPEVKAAAPFVETSGLLLNNDTLRPTLVRGISPADEATVSDLVAHDMPHFAALTPGSYNAVLGRELARALHVKVGDHVMLALGNAQPTGGVYQPRMRALTVSGIFSAGDNTFDAGLAYINLQDGETLLQLPGPSGLRLRVADLYRAPQVARALQASLPGDVLLRDWTTRNSTWFAAVQSQKHMMFIILGMIVAVAAFNVVSTLVMSVTDKQADIAILRTLGASPGAIVRIFMVQGALVGLAGTAIGVGAGVLLALNLPAMAAAVEHLLGIQLLDPSIYFISAVPSDLHWDDVLQIGVVAAALAFLATLYPSWWAARVKPAEALRYE